MNPTRRAFITSAYAWIPRPMFILWRINFALPELAPQKQGCIRSTLMTTQQPSSRARTAFASRLQTTGKNGGTAMTTGIRVSTNNRLQRTVMFVACAGCALAPTAVFAHHSRANYDMTKEIVVEGTV